MTAQPEPKVTEHRRSASMRLPGRKAGEISVSAAQSEYTRFELRVDVGTGDWIAVDTNMMYRCADKAALERFMCALVRSQRKVTWTRYIVVSYEAEGPGKFPHRKSYDKLYDRGDGDLLEIGSIRLDWNVLDVSQPIQYPGQDKPRRKKREVFDRSIDSDPNVENEDDWYGYEGWLHDELPDGAVSYTPDRYALLAEVRRALGRLDAKLAALFIGSNPAELAAQLDRAGLGSGISGLIASPRAQHPRSDHDGYGPCAACAPDVR